MIDSNDNWVKSIVGGFGIGNYDSVTTTYVGSTNNVNTQVFKRGTTTLGTLTYTYVGGVPSADNAKVSTIVKS